MQLKYLFVKFQRVTDVKDIKIGGGDTRRKNIEIYKYDCF